MSFRAIGKSIEHQLWNGFSMSKEMGEQVELPKSEEPIEIAELDEIHTYIERKKLLLGLDCCP